MVICMGLLCITLYFLCRSLFLWSRSVTVQSLSAYFIYTQLCILSSECESVRFQASSYAALHRGRPPERPLNCKTPPHLGMSHLCCRIKDCRPYDVSPNRRKCIYKSEVEQAQDDSVHKNELGPPSLTYCVIHWTHLSNTCNQLLSFQCSLLLICEDVKNTEQKSVVYLRVPQSLCLYLLHVNSCKDVTSSYAFSDVSMKNVSWKVLTWL